MAGYYVAVKDLAAHHWQHTVGADKVEGPLQARLPAVRVQAALCVGELEA